MTSDGGRKTDGRHFEDEEFPATCDHCPAPMEPGARFRRVLLVMDSEDNVAPEPGAVEVRSGMEESWELVLCPACQARLALWLRTPLKVMPADGEVVDELDDGELAAALEKELYVLSQDPTPRRLGNGADGDPE